MRRLPLRATAVLAAVLILATAAPAAQRSGRRPRAASFKPPAGPVAALVMDARTGAILHAHEIHRRWPPASTTKILTAILVIERLPLDRLVTIGPRAAAQRSGSSIGLEVGEQWSAGDLLHAMIVRSANDAAVALAEAHSGTIEAFADAMNARAKHLGARNSHFTNPHGLHDPNHYSTAYDLALIAREALHHTTFAGLARTQTWMLSRGDRPTQEFVNINKFLSRYVWADGVKTGWTGASGPCLVASATRDGWQLVAVVLNSQEMYKEAGALLDQAFHSFRLLQVAGRGDPMATVDLGRPTLRFEAILPADVHAVVKNGNRVTSRVRVRQDLRPPITAGDRVGDVVFLDGHSIVARSVLVASRTVGR